MELEIIDNNREINENIDEKGYINETDNKWKQNAIITFTFLMGVLVYYIIKGIINN